MGYLNYIETVFITKMNQKNFNEILLKLVIINMVYKIGLGIGKDQYQNKIFTPKFKLGTLKYLSELMIQVDPVYLENQDRIHLLVPDGASAIENLGTNILNVIEPFFKIISSVTGLVSQVPIQTLGPIVGALCLFFIVGLSVLRRDYIGRKNLQINVNKHLDAVRNLWETYIVYYLNGLGPNTTREIQTNSLEADRIIRTHKTTTYSLYWFLDWLQFALSAFTTYAIIEFGKSNNNDTTINTIQVFAMFYIISGVYSTTWWLFCAVRDTLTSTATWGTIELFIENYVDRNIDGLEDLDDLGKIFPQFASGNNINEVRLFAESGGGKTTWMKRKVVQMMTTFKNGWLYLDQKMRLPNDLRSIKSIMSDYVYEKIDPLVYTKTLCYYAEILGIDNVINESTLDQGFEKPSGGEEKRILTLRAFLPILLGSSNIKIIFNDEITAGLDDKNWTKVRTIIDEIKLKYGVKFVTIDHHEFEAEKLMVKKKTKSIKKHIEKPKPNDLISWLGSMFTSGIVKKEESKENKGIEVWIDGLESEPESEDEYENTTMIDDDSVKLIEMV